MANAKVKNTIGKQWIAMELQKKKRWFADSQKS
jgi:hypothetical protein